MHTDSAAEAVVQSNGRIKIGDSWPTLRYYHTHASTNNNNGDYNNYNNYSSTSYVAPTPLDQPRTSTCTSTTVLTATKSPSIADPATAVAAAVTDSPPSTQLRRLRSRFAVDSCDTMQAIDPQLLTTAEPPALTETNTSLPETTATASQIGNLPVHDSNLPVAAPQPQFDFEPEVEVDYETEEWNEVLVIDNELEASATAAVEPIAESQAQMLTTAANEQKLPIASTDDVMQGVYIVNEEVGDTVVAENVVPTTQFIRPTRSQIHQSDLEDGECVEDMVDMFGEEEGIRDTSMPMVDGGNEVYSRDEWQMLTPTPPPVYPVSTATRRNLSSESVVLSEPSCETAHIGALQSQIGSKDDSYKYDGNLLLLLAAAAGWNNKEKK